MNFEQSIPYGQRSWFGFINKEEKYLKPLVYKPDEIFKHHPTLPLVVGNYGTIINEAYFGFKMIPTLDSLGHPSIGYIITINGQKKIVKGKVCNIMMETFIDGFSTKTHKVVHLDSDYTNNIYAPWSPYNNLKPMSVREFMAWRSQNDLRKSDHIISSDISDNEIHKICQMMQKGMSNDEIIETLCLPNNYNSRVILIGIRNKKLRPDISALYDIPKRKLYHCSLDDYDYICKLASMGYKPAKLLKMCHERGINISMGTYYSILKGKVDQAIPFLEKYNLMGE